MKKAMKKAIMMIALLAVPFALQAQTKFHDVEANEAKGPVAKISQSIMGIEQVTTFTKDGKMQRDGMSDAVYNEEGYLQTAKIEAQGMKMDVSYQWENGMVKSQSMDVMGQKMTVSHTYNEKGAPASDTIDAGGQTMTSAYTDYKYDDRGNWISRKTNMMGNDIEQTRTIEYYE
jgi:uncharacterized protein YxeA